MYIFGQVRWGLLECFVQGLKANQEKSAIIHAVENGHLEVVNILIDAGANVNEVDGNFYWFFV